MYVAYMYAYIHTYMHTNSMAKEAYHMRCTSLSISMNMYVHARTYASAKNKKNSQALVVRDEGAEVLGANQARFVGRNIIFRKLFECIIPCKHIRICLGLRV